ncbi:TRAP transporter small permease subunit [Microvirga aerilata]|jgi:TRAP-type C4-dicarboxylate transport system permease small subunit|uniref:TRAP transporter small permease protein n=1 Tax=Microvirga aerilata TaxID=670292 RepID=A0A936ZDG8_9HYPH|nr:TRAP transporter small permease subunit [Microvirga aerilata]MBL0405117.1 TRAP transporter small permease subunit [Microvirga aerilata]
MQLLRARLHFFAELVTVLLFMAMFAAFLLQVFTRYVLNDPVAWTQEFVLIMYIWIVFWCGAFLLKEREHITFDMFFLALPPRQRRILAIVLTALTGLVFIVALPATFDYVTFMKIEKSPVMGIRFDILYSIFIVFVVAVAVGALWRIWRLLGRSWQSELVAGGDVEP